MMDDVEFKEVTQGATTSFYGGEQDKTGTPYLTIEQNGNIVRLTKTQCERIPMLAERYIRK